MPEETGMALRRLPWLNIVLLLLTVASTIAAGYLYGAMGLFGLTLPPWVSGLLFASTLLLILGAHELGHYFVARLNGVEASLPYFIPVPLGIGTLGAFIRMRSDIPNRRTLFDVGLAGPLAGLALAVPLFIAGLLLAPIYRHPLLYGDGLLMRGLILLVEHVRGLPPDHHLQLHPVSFAAYISLFITAVNLLPAGQLDGGHVAYAALGRRSFIFAVVIVLSLAIVGLVTRRWNLLLWAGLITLFGLRHPPTADDESSLDGVRWLLAAAACFILLMLFAVNPLPLAG